VGRTAPPRHPRAARGVPELPVERFALRCGTTLLVSPRRGAPVFAVQAHVRGGHSLDASGLGGTAFLAGRLVDQGARGWTEEEIATRLEPAGGTLSGSSTGISGQIAGEEWRALLECLSACLVAPTYPEAKVELHRKRLLDRLLLERDDPRTQGAWLFRRLVYGKHWLGRPDYGSIESVRRIRRAHLAQHHRRHWFAKRAVIAVSGDVDPLAVKRVLERGLAGWKPGADLPPPDLRFPALERRTAVFPAQRQQVHVYLGHLGIRRTDPDYAALVVMDHVLGTGPGFTSRITRRLRDELGLAYAVNAAIHSSAGVLPGMFMAYIGTSPQHLRVATRGFLAEIERIRTEPVAKEELRLARDYLTGSFALGYERAARRVQTLISAHRNGLPDDHLTQLLRSFETVGVEDVRRVARAHLHPLAACVAVTGPVGSGELAGLLEEPRGSRRLSVRSVRAARR
jgi:zinc protease